MEQNNSFTQKSISRCLTVLGHVDHGKTTFVDSLLAANNIISARMAGKIRYMDSREDEQQRGITMESSAVSLRFKLMKKLSDGGTSAEDYVINLIDTPGHVDFSSEVSTASRLCDGALVMIDVVEGVCTQTIAVLRQAWIDRLRPVLVINKLDRLVTELKLAPIEAYHHLVQLLEQVNAVMGGFFASDRMEDDLRWREDRERRLQKRKDAGADQLETDANSTTEVSPEEEEAFQEKDDEDIYFAPERGNVIFASAIDGWAFRIGKFAQLYAAKLGTKESNLRRVLWGDFYLDPKSKRVISHKQLKGRNLKPLFVQFVLENIWAVYDSVVINPNPDKISKIVSALSLKVPPRDLKSKDPSNLLSSIFTQWLPLSTATFQAVVDIIPPPFVAQRYRVPKMLYPDLREDTVEPKNKLERDLWSCDTSEEACVVAYVSKMFAVPVKELPQNKRKQVTAEELRDRGRSARAMQDAGAAGEGATSTPAVPPPIAAEDEGLIQEDETLIGFARLYSGTLHLNTHIYCILPKYTTSLPPTHPRNTPHILSIKITALYVMMGRELVPVESVKAGSVFAVGGLEGRVWRNATLCGPGAKGLGSLTLDGAERDMGAIVNLAGVNRQSAPIVRVALEPVNPADMPKMVRGLKLLSQSDPCAETFQQQTGEWVILTAGELHLERCLKDLRERFAKVEIQASEPIVPFRETAVKGHDMAPPKTPQAPRGTISGSSSHSVVRFTIRAIPLPNTVTSFLQANISIIKRLQKDAQNQQGLRDDHTRQNGNGAAEEEDDEEAAIADGDVVHKPTVRLEDFWTTLDKLLTAAGNDWKGVADRIWTFGPKRVGPNILIDRTTSTTHSLRKQTARQSQTNGDSKHTDARQLREFDDNVETGFQIATLRGPLCAEPVEGMAYFVQSIDLDMEKLDEEKVHARMAQVTGSLISSAKDACRSGLLDWSPRLKMAMYTCDIQASTDVLGKVYSVVARRRGRIVSEEMKEGTSFFTIRSLLPVAESFGFADEIRKRTSGAASPQLIFSGYEILDQDPFWVPTTEEELEDLGEKADRANVARQYMDGVRKRKGLFVEKKVVEFAEKQRTLKK